MPEVVTEAEKALRKAALTMTAADFFEDVFTKAWLKLSVDEQVAFRNKLDAYTGAAAKIRAEFDKTVWAGHSDGTVDARVDSIRAQRTGETPGRKPKPKSMEDILLG